MENQPQNQNKIDVLIVGSTGHLGHHMAREALKNPNLRVHVLSHDLNLDKDLCDLVTKSGGKCLKCDVTKPQEIKGVCKGIHTVVSCLAGGDKVFVDGQMALLNEAIQSGVKRFVPSEFGIDLKNVKMGDVQMMDDKLLIRQQMEKANIKGLHVSCGLFIDTLPEILGNEICCDPNQKVTVISMEDCARITVNALADPNRAGDLRIAGETLTIKQVCDTLSKTHGKIETKSVENVEERKKKLQEAKSKGDMKLNSRLGIQELISEGKGVINQPNQEVLGNVKPRTLEEWCTKHHSEKPLIK